MSTRSPIVRQPAPAAWPSAAAAPRRCRGAGFFRLSAQLVAEAWGSRSKHGGTQAALFCGHGQVNRDGCLAGSAFLADDSNCFHGCVFAPQCVVLFVSIHKNVQTCKRYEGPKMSSDMVPALHLAGTGEVLPASCGIVRGVRREENYAFKGVSCLEAIHLLTPAPATPRRVFASASPARCGRPSGRRGLDTCALHVSQLACLTTSVSRIPPTLSTKPMKARQGF
jgi:hypothetical protein